MSDMNHMDELFRESFRDYQPEVPPHIWENIAARKKKRRAIGWKPLGLLLLILAGSLGGWWMMNWERGMMNREHGISNKKMPSPQPSTNNQQPEDGSWQLADGRKTGTGYEEQGTKNREQGISNKKPSRQPSTNNRQPDEQGITNKVMSSRHQPSAISQPDEQGMMNREQGISNKKPSRQPSTNSQQPEDGSWLLADGRKTGTGYEEQGTKNREQGISNKKPSRQPSTNNRQPDEQGITNKVMSSRHQPSAISQPDEQGMMNREQGISNKKPSRQPSTNNRQPDEQGMMNREQRISNREMPSRHQPSAIRQPNESSILNDDDSSNLQLSTFNFQLSSRQLNLEKLALNTTPGSRPIRPIRIPDCPPADNDRPAAQDYWEVYAGPDYAMKQYSSTDPVLVEKRKETQSIQWAYSAGARYTRVFSNGISLRAGVNYTQINEKFSYLQDNVVQLIYIISPAGDTTDSYYVRGTRYKNSVNRYRSIDLPVSLGYELGNGRLRANINAGVIINLRSWQSGSTIDQNLLPVNFNASNTVYQYKTNAGLAFTGAVSLYYRLSDRMHLLAEPYYRHNLSPISKEAGPVQERFRIMGLRLGLRMDIP